MLYRTKMKESAASCALWNVCEDCWVLFMPCWGQGRNSCFWPAVACSPQSGCKRWKLILHSLCFTALWFFLLLWAADWLVFLLSFFFYCLQNVKQICLERQTRFSCVFGFCSGWLGSELGWLSNCDLGLSILLSFLPRKLKNMTFSLSFMCDLNAIGKDLGNLGLNFKTSFVSKLLLYDE